MNIKNPFELIETGSNLALGMIGTFLEILENSQKPEANPTQKQQQINQLLHELEAKGKEIGKNPEQLLNSLLSSINPCNSTRYPLFVNTGGMQQYPQPSILKNYQLYGFVVEGSLPHLQTMCDKYLNEPTQGKTDYRPVTNLVLITFGNSPYVNSIPLENRGYFSEKEAMVWVLTMAGKQVGPFFFIDRLAWFIPYIFVDESYIMAIGREVFGFPKGWGWFDFPDRPMEPEKLTIPEKLSVETLVLKNFSPETKATREKIIEVSQVDKNQQNLLSNSRNSLDEVFKDIAQTLFEDEGVIKIPSLGLDLQVLDYFTGDVEVPMVHLKQFRDIKYGERACYQAIVESPSKLLNFRSGGLLSTGSKPSDLFQVKVNEFDSHPIVSELGLKTGGEQIAKTAFWLDFDFKVESGQEIWRAF